MLTLASTPRVVWRKIDNLEGIECCSGCVDGPPAAFAGVVDFESVDFEILACETCFALLAVIPEQ